ncbi:CRISPR-associated endoribonuclease Cas6 [Thermaerobacter litoralis]
MRVIMELRPAAGQLVLPLQYNGLLQGLVYHLMEGTDVAAFLHDQGFTRGARRYKMFTFSRLEGLYTIERRSFGPATNGIAPGRGDGREDGRGAPGDLSRAPHNRGPAGDVAPGASGLDGQARGQAGSPSAATPGGGKAAALPGQSLPAAGSLEAAGSAAATQAREGGLSERQGDGRHSPGGTPLDASILTGNGRSIDGRTGEGPLAGSPPPGGRSWEGQGRGGKAPGGPDGAPAKIIRFAGSVRLTVSSPYAPVVHAVASRALQLGSLRLGSQVVEVESVRFEELPPITPPVTLRARTPITVYSTVNRPDGSRFTYFFEPRSGEFERLVAENLVRKWEAFTGRTYEGPGIQIRWRGAARGHVARFRHGIIKGFTGTFEASGDPALIALGLEAGFGSKNAQGFGLCDLEPQRAARTPQPRMAPPATPSPADPARADAAGSSVAATREVEWGAD